jgi:hypothetical protein
MFYESKLKPQFDVMWNACSHNGIPSKNRIRFVKQFMQENFLKESEAVKAMVRAKCEQEYAEAMEAWKARMDWSATPESYET